MGSAPHSAESVEGIPLPVFLRSNRRASSPQSTTQGEAATHHRWLPKIAASTVAVTTELMIAAAQNLADSRMAEEEIRVITRPPLKCSYRSNSFCDLRGPHVTRSELLRVRRVPSPVGSLRGRRWAATQIYAVSIEFLGLRTTVIYVHVAIVCSNKSGNPSGNACNSTSKHCTRNPHSTEDSRGNTATYTEPKGLTSKVLSIARDLSQLVCRHTVVATNIGVSRSNSAEQGKSTDGNHDANDSWHFDFSFQSRCKQTKLDFTEQSLTLLLACARWLSRLSHEPKDSRCLVQDLQHSQ